MRKGKTGYYLDVDEMFEQVSLAKKIRVTLHSISNLQSTVKIKDN